MESALHFDLATVSPSELLNTIRMRLGGSAVSINITGASGQDFVGAGLRDIHEVEVHGNIGDFGFCSFGDGVGKVEGNVGSFFAHSIASGILVVRGHAKHAVGALGRNGLVAIFGNAADRTAIGMQGADIVVRGSVANYAGLGMQNGTLIVGGGAGKHLGYGMRGGTIYLRGEAESISSNVEENRLREPDRLKIGMLMLKSNIKSVGKEFRVFRPVREEV